MAHIANCIANPEPGSISNHSSRAPPMLSTTPPTSAPEKPFAWRMQRTDQQRKYQLFPKEKQLPVLNSGKALDPEKAFAIAMGQDGGKSDKTGAGANLRLRINQHNLVRRRKVSVPELGPMTTVQEVAMDSPTIPGRPPLHERSMSAPDDTTKTSRFVAVAPVLVTEEHDEDDFAKAIEEAFAAAHSTKHLAPLVIPKSNSPAPLLQSKISAVKLRSDSTPPLESSRVDVSPMSRARFTPGTSTPDLTYPRSATTDGASATTLPTPVSAPLMESHGASPRPWDGAAVGEHAVVPNAEDERPGHVYSHRRGASESSSVMNRGRPRKRADVRNNNGPLLRYSESKRAKSSEQRAFEELPRGWRASDAMSKLNANDVATLHKQAFGQAERFEVLRVEDVEALSKELRRLDDRTEYLRRTYTSLRAGRRNLHSRICQYRRSPRVARFSHESMLKQEEALGELDASIDDWVAKLEQAENRRTRVRQKLLEHVAAATILPAPGSPAAAAAAASESLQRAMGMRSPPPRDISTPPRSPSKQTFFSRTASSSPSPQRVVAQVPSTILEYPVVEEAAEKGKRSRATSTTALKRADVESIRIYAGDDVYALLADVENEISKMSSSASEQAPMKQLGTERERQRSHERPDESEVLLTSAVFKP
ncbi:hypothetical protein TOPH_05681 [Tolypocladium ophioglossoides CBS 100239]|uniref:Up-regulated during septation protein 1 domain-containing protein n=1 Tax=Tolypocladium ophioglossoides (strain CBS 100239) TaxID=1163406 RepID=A0A0L0N7E2_TOLOC|nr:hypothetical protein TOPH_05681 [Tolypocladium ophioglossoides CBS 100239]